MFEVAKPQAAPEVQLTRRPTATSNGSTSVTANRVAQKPPTLLELSRGGQKISLENGTGQSDGVSL
eukprot:4403835-Prymnesium_polylepis.1